MQSLASYLIEGQEWYRDVYLSSEHWKNLRAEKLSINPKCERCGRDHSLQVHHVRYRNIYDVKISDLQTLCRECHEKAHDVPKKSRKQRKATATNAVLNRKPRTKKQLALRERQIRNAHRRQDASARSRTQARNRERNIQNERRSK